MRLSTAAVALLVAAVSGAAPRGVAALRGRKTDTATTKTLGLSDLAAEAVVSADDRQYPSHQSRAPRSLMMEEHPGFAPLTCNDSIDTPNDASSCVPWSGQGYDGNAGLVTIPCGTCVDIDAAAAGVLDLPNGLNVEGKLRINVDELGPGFSVDIRTPFVVVQGILDITSSRTVSPANEAVKFSMTGDASTSSAVDLPSMIHSDNSMACMNMCSVGKQAFAIVGGRLDITALPAQCPSWTRIEDIVTRPVAVPDPASIPPVPQPNAGCDANGIFLDEDFSDGAGWNSHYSPGGFELSSVDSHAPGDQYFRAKGRSASWQGPMINVDPTCLVPDALYVVTAKAKLVLTSDFALAESSCQSAGQKCLQPVYHHQEAGGTNPTWKGMGNKLGQYNGDGEWFDVITTVKFTQKEATPGDRSRLYFDGPEAGIDVLLDDVKIELAGPEYYFPTTDTCSELVVNGGADNFLTNPVYTNAYGTSLVVEEEEEGGVVNRYFSLKDRYGYWHSAETKPLLDCVQEGDVYTFSMRVRMRTSTPVRARLMFKSMTDPSGPDTSPNSNWDALVYCPYQTEDDGWVTCAYDHAFTAHQAEAGLVKFYAEVQGENGEADFTVDYDDLSIAFKSGPGVGIQVPADVLPCWGDGSEIMVTSHTIQFDDASVKTITGTSINAESGHAVLDLDTPVPYAVTTQKDVAANPDVALATEVALLTRNVVFESVDVPYYGTPEGGSSTKQGAHMIVYHTPHVAQTIEGVAVRKFGQAGTLGKYPFHFHMSGNVHGSVLSKNVVRESFQRCYVVHGSHNVTMADNVAYETFGHCYFLEDSAEMDNVFLRNLGAVTRNTPSSDMITSQPETDNEASTFWMTNPVNSWEGNVAAGSEHSGFWFEMRTSVRGPSADMFPTMNPKVLPLGTFVDNAMHSNSEHGLKTYPGAGYEPEIEAVFTNTASYRNKGAGVFFHNSRNLGLQGGFYADNRIQVDFDRAPTTRVSDAVVTGYSPLYKDVVAASGGMWWHYHCPSNYPMVGVQLHTFWAGSEVSRGSVVENVQFNHLGEADTGCQGSRAINVDDEDKGYFDVRTSLAGLTFDAHTDKFEVCHALEEKSDGDGGIDFVAIKDDGSVSGGAGYLVSDSPRMTGLLPDGTCSPLPGGDTCALSCPNLCLRSRLYRTSGLTPADTKLIVTDTTDPTLSVELYGYFEENFLDMAETVPDVNENTLVWRDRLFHVVVPEGGGPYEARFESADGTEYWPRFVEVVDQDVPGNCGASFPTINVIEPAVAEGYCEELVHNGDMEGGLDGWQNNGGGLAIHAAGVTGQALKSDVRYSTWNGPGQYLDTRCLVEGDEYRLTAKVKLTNDSDGADPGCDPAGGGCPQANFIVQTSSMPEDRDWVSVAWGTKTGTWSNGGWNEMTNTFTVTADMANAESVFLYFEGVAPGVDIIVDDVSIAPEAEEEVVACGATILDESFTDSMEGWNGNYNPGGFQLETADSHTPGDTYFWVKGRTQTWHGPMINPLDLSCVQPGKLYFLSAKVKYEFTSAHVLDVANTCEFNSDRCLTATYYRRDANGQAYYRNFGGKVKQAPGEWFEFSGSYTFTEDDLTPGGDAYRLYFEKPEAGVDIKIDDVHLREAPAELFPPQEAMCDEMIVNGGGEIVPPYTYPLKANAWKTTLLLPSETVGADINHYFKITDRYGNWHSIEYFLPVGCITAGETYTFSVKTRIHTTVAARPKFIMKAEPMNEYKLLTYCPTQSISNLPATEWIECTADYTWTPNQAIADRVKFYVEVPEDINADIDFDDFSFVPKLEAA